MFTQKFSNLDYSPLKLFFFFHITILLYTTGHKENKIS